MDGGCMSDVSISPRHEAHELLSHMEQSGESPDSVRKLITCDSSDSGALHYRQKVLLSFEIALWKRPQGPLPRGPLPPVLRGAACDLLKSGLSHETINKRLPIGLAAIHKLSVEIGAAYLKPHGRGRRFTPEFREKIRAAVKSGCRSCDIERQFQIDEHTVRDVRRELGDFENRTLRQKLTPEQLAQAANQIASGRRWRDVAAALHVSPSTLLRWCTFRKRPSYRHFSDEEEREVLAAVKRGEGKRSIAQRLGRPRSSISLLMNRLRAKHPELPRKAGLLPEQISAIVRARARGRTFADISREFHLSAAGVFRIVKRSEAHR